MSLPVSDDLLRAKVQGVVSNYFAEFRHPRTFVPYGHTLKTKTTWTSPDDIRAKKPQPWGYGSRIEDTALHAGHLLGALLAAYGARPEPWLAQAAREMFAALRFIYSKSPVPGLVPRGPHPDDESAVYDDSSMDQHTTFIISLCRYAQSPLAGPDEKVYVAKVLDEVGTRLEQNGFAIKRADGVTQSHVGFAWLGMVHEHASILMPALAALYAGTGNPHWQERYEAFGAEAGGKRWALLAPGEHVKINAHPVYANQNCFRLEALWHLETNAARRATVGMLLAQTTHIQWERPYPNAFLTNLLRIDWPRLARDCGWGGETLPGIEAAWRLFQPAFFDFPDAMLRGNAQLAHVRFPLGALHMALLSQDLAMTERGGVLAWDMLDRVTLGRIENGETRYLFAVVALLLYAERFTVR